MTTPNFGPHATEEERREAILYGAARDAQRWIEGREAFTRRVWAAVAAGIPLEDIVAATQGRIPLDTIKRIAEIPGLRHQAS